MRSRWGAEPEAERQRFLGIEAVGFEGRNLRLVVEANATAAAGMGVGPTLAFRGLVRMSQRAWLVMAEGNPDREILVGDRVIPATGILLRPPGKKQHWRTKA